MGGLTPDRVRREVARTDLPAPSLETAFFDLAWFLSIAAPLAGAALGVPALAVLGMIYDLSLLMYATATGRDFDGNEVSQGQLLLMAVFAAVSVTGDVSEATLRIAARVEKKLLVDTAFVSLNPGFWPMLQPYLERHLSPLITDALTRMQPADAQRLLLGIVDAASDLSPTKVKVLATLFGATLSPLLAGVGYVDDIPVPLYLYAIDLVRVADTEAFRALDAAEQTLVLDGYKRALSTGDPSLLDLGSVSEELADEYGFRIGDAIISRVFNPELTGFRRPTWGPVTSALQQGYRTYDRGKLARGEEARDVLDWARVQPSNSQYVPLLVAELGSGLRAAAERDHRPRPLCGHRARRSPLQAARRAIRLVRHAPAPWSAVPIRAPCSRSTTSSSSASSATSRDWRSSARTSSSRSSSRTIRSPCRTCGWPSGRMASGRWSSPVSTRRRPLGCGS